MKRRLLSIAVTLAMCLSLLPAPALAAQEESGSTGQEETFAFVPGVVPEPVQLVYPSLPGATLADLPSQYTSEFVDVTTVRDQFSLGLCWTFGALGAVEANLYKSLGRTADLSEAHMAYSTSVYALASDDATATTACNENGFYREIDGGGHRYHAATYLMRNILLSGAVNETSDPYPANEDDRKNMPPRTVAETQNIGTEKTYTVGDILFLTGDKTEVDSASDKTIIKQAIMDYGAVAASMFYDGNAVSGEAGAAFNNGTNAYYYSGNELTPSGYPNTNHMVLIVGWDDTYASYNFSNNPGANGAWKVQNSWGNSWGDNGYFWVSYYDTNFPCNAFAVDGVDGYNSGLTVWEDDYGMSLGSVCLNPSNLSNYYAEVYQRSELIPEKVTAVKVFVPEVTAGVEVTVGVDPTALTEEAKTASSIFTTLDTTTKTISYPGWYTIQLEEPVSLTADTEAFTAYVKITDLNDTVDSHAVKIGLDYTDKTGSTVATPPTNACYGATSTGSFTSLSSEGYNACIKAVTTPTAQAAVTTAPTAAEDLMYDGTAKDLLETAGVAENGTMVYSLTEDGEYSETIPTATDAKSYTVYYKAKSNSQFGTDSEINSVTVTIAQKPLTVTAKDVELQVDDDVPATSDLEYTSEGLVDGHTIAAQLDYVGVSEPLLVGNYAIEVQQITITDTLGNDVTSNYQITSTSGILTVTAHTHVWTISAPGDGTLLATCPDCSYPDGLTIQLSAEDTTYTGSEVTAQVKIMNGDEEVSSISQEDLGLKLTYNATAVDVGNYTATLAVETEPTTSISVSFAITAQTLVDNITIALNDTGLIYTGENIEPAVTVTLLNGTMLTADEHYTVTYENNINAGSQAKVIITGTGNYSGSVEQTFTIQPKSLTDAMVALTSGSWSYTGLEIKPTVTVTDGQNQLTENTHYSVTYEDNVNAGIAAKVIVTGTGNYGSTVTKTFTIEKAVPNIGAVTIASPATVYTSNDPAAVELTYANQATIPGTIVLDDTATAFIAGNNSRTWTFTPNDTNYNVLTGTITISAVADTVQSISVTPPTKATYTYGEGLDFSGTTVMATFTSGQNSNVTSAVSYSVDGNAVVSGQTLDASNDPITVTVSFTSGGSTVTGTFTITIAPATPVVTAPTANPLNYNGSAQDLIRAGATTGGTLYYAVTTENSQPNDAAYTTTVPTAKEIGTYYVWYKVVGNNNYNDVAADYVSVSIDMGNLSCSNTLTKSVLYNNTQPQTVTAADFGIQVSGGTFSIGAGYQDGGILNTPYLVANDTVIFELNPGLSYSQTASAQIPLTYTVDNYNPVDLMLTITLADKAIPNVSAAAYSKVYDGTAVNPSDITITSDVPGSLALYTGQTITNVGTANYVLTFVPDDTNSYSSVSVNAVVTITKAPLTIAADDVTFTSSAVDTPALTYKVTGLVNGETLEDIGLTVSCGTNASDYVTVGTYTITVSGNTEPSNYTVTYLPGTLTISPIPVVNYVVTFDPNGGSVNVTSATTSNGKLTSLPTVTRSGYTFNGWYTAATGGTKVTVDTMFSADTTIYAQWTYIDSGSTGGGSSVDSSSSGGSSSSNSTTNADGSTTTTTTNKDGSVTQETTFKDGSKSEMTVNKDGSAEFEAKMSDGSTATATISSEGKVEAEVKLSDKATFEAVKNDEVLPLPIPAVPVTDNRGEASVINVSASDDYETKIEVPVENVTPGTVVILVDKNGKETIVPKSSVTKDGVVFAAQGNVTVKIVDNAKSFDDVKPNFWGKNSVAFVTSRELFSGTSANFFSPNEPMTRAMIFTVLARLDGQDPTGGANWWDKGMDWAKSAGLTDGSNPQSRLTREQLAVMLYNYAGKPTVDTSKLDKTGVSNWAENAMAWCVSQGVMAGDQNGNLNAGDNATRAEVATMLMSFVSSNNR